MTADKNAIAEELGLLKAKLQGAEIDRKTDEMKRRTKPLPGFEQDPQTGEIYYGQHKWDEQKGDWVFERGPGVGAPKLPGGQQAILQSLIHSGAAKDEADALRVYNNLRRDPNSEPQAFARLLQSEISSLRNTPQGMAMNPQQLEAQARKNVQARMAAAPGAQTASPAAQPTNAQTPATANAPKPPPIPTKLGGIQLKGYSPSTGYFYGVDGKKYDKEGNPVE